MYYGLHKISEIKDLDDGHIEIFFEDEEDKEGELQAVPSEITSKDLMEFVQTQEPMDATYLHDKRIQKMKSDVMLTLSHHNMYATEFPAIMQALSDFITAAMEQADEQAWGMPHYRKSLHSCNELLKDKPIE